MLSQDLPLGKPMLEEAIDYHPLVVTPDILLTETLALMSQIQSPSCSLPNLENSIKEYIPSKVRSNCVLVMKGKKLEGIFTERDLVRLIASGRDFEKVNIGEVMSHPVITLTEADFQDIFAALFLFRRYRIRHLPILDEQGQLVGVVSHESLRSCLRPTNLLKLRRVSDVMSANVVQASLTSSVLKIARLMAEHRVSCVVMTEDFAEEPCLPVGIITERDLLQFQALELDLSQVKAEEVMSTPLFLLSPEDSLWFAHEKMQKMNLRRLVVSWNWGLGLGIITQTSLLRVFDPMEMYGVIETLQRTVQELKEEKGDGLVEGAVEAKQVGSLSTPEFKEKSLDKKSNSAFSDSQLDFLLCNLQDKLNNLINDPEMLPEKRQHLLSLGIADVERLRKLSAGLTEKLFT